MGFSARRVMALTCGETAELVRKFAQRSGLLEASGQALAKEVGRAEYASLAQVPVTLNLLLHVLARKGVGDAVLSRRERTFEASHSCVTVPR
jgi:hypothetical protein